MRSAKTKGAPNCVWLQSFRLLCNSIHIMWMWLLQPWGHQTRCGHSQSAAYWPFHLQKDESPKPVAKWWEPQTKPVVEDFCQSAVFVRIEWRWISTELTDHGKCKGNYLRCLSRWQQTWRWQKNPSKEDWDRHGALREGREVRKYVCALINRFLRKLGRTSAHPFMREFDL